MNEFNKEQENKDSIELAELLAELEGQSLLEEVEKDGLTIELESSIPLSEDEVHSFSFEEEASLTEPMVIDIENTVHTKLENGTTHVYGIKAKTDIFNEEGLTEELRKQMLYDNTLHEDEERVIDNSEFTDLISEVLEEQQEYQEEHGGFYETESFVDMLKEKFEGERATKLLDVQNNVLSIQQEEEEITEYILCEGVYDESFKIFIHTSPLVITGSMPLVINIDEEYILFRRINPEPKVLNILLKTLPNFKFTHVKATGETPLNPFSFLNNCNFSN